MLQVGPMISSKNITWTGENKFGNFHASKTGMVTKKIKGM